MYGEMLWRYNRGEYDNRSMFVQSKGLRNIFYSDISWNDHLAPFDSSIRVHMHQKSLFSQ